MLRPKALLTTIPSDSHSWNLVYIEMVLQELGFRVENLGVCVPLDVLAEEVACSRPDLVVVSTVNGHGSIEGVDIAERLGDLPCRGRIRVVVGGKLTLTEDQESASSCAGRLLRAGFDGVFGGPCALQEFRAQLERWFPDSRDAAPLVHGELGGAR